VTRIAEVLLDLQKAGNVTYSGWKVSFDCATYTDIGSGKKEEVQLQMESAEQRVKELQAYAKKMEEDLVMWENEVKKSRSHHYELNYYTTLQLLRLRKELGLVRQNPTKMVDPQILALLESISPKVSSGSVQSIISNLKKELLDLPLLPEENTQVEPAITEDLSDSPSESAELHTEALEPVEMSSPSLSSVRTSDKPLLTKHDLTDSQNKIFTDLVEYKKYSPLLVLKAFEQLPATSNPYDIQDWCDEKDGTYDFEDEEEENNDRKASSSSGVVPKVKVIHRQIINESHPVVQQLVEEYEYDLDASIEAVVLFGTLQRAMDYLAGKEGDSGDEMIAPSAALPEPTLEER
jgi:hypothetical protein